MPRTSDLEAQVPALLRVLYRRLLDMAATSDLGSQAPEHEQPSAARAAVWNVLDAGPIALATRLNVPDRITHELRRGPGSALPAGAIRARIRGAGRVRSAWSVDPAGKLTLDVDGLARLHLSATPLADRNLSGPSGWMLTIESCEPLTPAPSEIDDVPAHEVIDAARDLDAVLLQDEFLVALREIVREDSLTEGVTAWLSDLARRWTVEPSPTGPRGLHLVRLDGGLALCIEVLDDGRAPLRARFDDPAPDPGALLALVLPHLSAAALALGPAAIPTALPLLTELEPDAGDRLLALVAERLDGELSPVSPKLTAGLELSHDTAAICEQRWQLNADEAPTALAELLTLEGTSVSRDGEAGVLPTWKLTASVLTATLRLAVAQARLVVETLDVCAAPGCLFAADLAQSDQGFRPWTLIDIDDAVLDQAFFTHTRLDEGERLERRRRFGHALALAGSLRRPDRDTGCIDVGTALKFVGTHKDAGQPRLCVDRLETLLSPVWREFRDRWLGSVRFMPGVREWVCGLLGLAPRGADDWLMARWASLVPRLGIDPPPGGRPDVSLWIEFTAAGAGEGHAPREAHLALVADPPNLWREDSLFAVGFIGDPSLELPAPDWLRDQGLAVPSVEQLAAEARRGLLGRFGWGRRL